MFRPPFLARVAAGAAVYAIEETRRLPTAAMNFPITAISQMLQTSMHIQQFVTSLALKGDAVFEQLTNSPVEQPEWATFDEDETSGQTSGADFGSPARASRFDLYAAEDFAPSESMPGDSAAGTGETNGHAFSLTADTEKPEIALQASAPQLAPPETATPEPAVTENSVTEAAAPEITEPEVATRYDYATMTLAQLRARLRMLTIEDLTTLLDYEQQTRARAPFVTMLTNRIATVRTQ